MGFKYIVSGTCLFSKWVEAEPIKAKSAECVYQVLVKWIHRWGAPLKILSDQGTEFNNKVCNIKFLCSFRPFATIGHRPD